MERKRLNIDASIIMANAEKIKNGESLIKDKKHLAEIIALKIGDEKDNLYMRLYRAEKDGFIVENESLIKSLIGELNVSKEFLVSNI